jgi:hypothetical protein
MSRRRSKAAVVSLGEVHSSLNMIRECIQKFLDWEPGARTSNGTDRWGELDSTDSGWSPVAGFCEHGNEP